MPPKKKAPAKRASKTPSSKRPKKRTRAPVRVTCSATKRNGKPCGLPPIKGGTVCHKHGGSAPQVRAAANRRLIEMVIPAMKELHKIIDREDVADADKLRAIQMVLNRTGYSERQTIDIGLREETPFDRLSKGSAFTILRGEDMRKELEELSAEGRRELPAHHGQPADLGGGVDDDLEAFLEQRARARQREASTHISHGDHEVVTGEVIQRSALDPFQMEERRRAEYERASSEFGPRPPRDDPDRAYEDRLRERIEESEGR